MPDPLTKPVLFLAEGRTCEFFLRSLVTHLNLGEQVEVRDFGGVTELRRYLLATVVDSGFSNVSTVGVFRDAEANAEGAFESLASALENAGLDRPPAHGQITEGAPRTAGFVFPDGSSAGMLETLCMRAVAYSQRIPCVDEYLECLGAAGAAPRNEGKSRAYAYIAASEKPDVHLGIAVQKGEFDLDNEAFLPLQDFIRALVVT